MSSFTFVAVPWSRGPWNAFTRPVNGYYPLHDADNQLIDVIRGSRFTCRDDATQIANVRLIVLAPLMADAIMCAALPAHGSALKIAAADAMLRTIVDGADPTRGGAI